MRMVADRHRLTGYQKALLTSFPGVPSSMTLNDLEPQKWVFSDFFRDFMLRCTRPNYWR